MIHCGITATKGRHPCIERIVSCFLHQTYPLTRLVIFNNSTTPLQLDGSIEGRNIILVNNHLNYSTRNPYTSLGEIYNDVITHIPKEADVVTFMDDDDFFLPNYVEEGIRGYKGLPEGYKAYKPLKSYFKTHKSTVLAQNVLEPSIFVEAAHIKQYGFYERNVDLHHKWLSPLIDNKQIFADPKGIPTFIYDWSQEIFAYKTSGDPNNPFNFSNYNKYSVDEGDRIISPAEQLYKLTIDGIHFMSNK